MSNVIKTGDKKIIFNGGDPLKDCPTSWDEANKWTEEKNKGREDSSREPNWNWDCGFKLDFDGAILSVSSRFYPPKSYYGDRWDGTITISLFGKEIFEKSFIEDTLEDLHKKVESFVYGLENKISFKDLF